MIVDGVSLLLDTITLRPNDPPDDGRAFAVIDVCDTHTELALFVTPIREVGVAVNTDLVNIEIEIPPEDAEFAPASDDTVCKSYEIIDAAVSMIMDIDTTMTNVVDELP